MPSCVAMAARFVGGRDEATYFGSISARGGSKGGNGGMAEGPGDTFYFSPRRSVDLTAAARGTGTLLLDPPDITIDDSWFTLHRITGSVSGSTSTVPCRESE